MFFKLLLFYLFEFQENIKPDRGLTELAMAIFCECALGMRSGIWCYLVERHKHGNLSTEYMWIRQSLDRSLITP